MYSRKSVPKTPANASLGKIIYTANTYNDFHSNDPNVRKNREELHPNKVEPKPKRMFKTSKLL